MKISVSDMTIKDKKVLDNLRSYLSRLECYPNFDPTQLVQVYVNNSMDFTGLESVSYMWSFISQRHKIVETITSRYQIDPITYSEFRLALNRL